MGNYYTLKDVLLGLRKEQGRIQGKLRELEKMLNNYGDKRYENSHFISALAGEYQTLYYNLMINYSLKEKISNLLLNHVNYFNFKGASMHLTKNEQGAYQLLDKGINLVKEENQVDFNQKVGEILNDKIVLDLNGERIIVEDNEVCVYNSHLFSTILSNSNKRNKASNDFNAYIYYAKPNDLFGLIVRPKYFGKRTDDIIQKFLQIKMPKEIFSSYIQNIIDNSEDVKKEIIIPSDRCFKRYNEFYLNEERDHFALVKKK